MFFRSAIPILLVISTSLSAQFDLQWQTLKNLGGSDQGFFIETYTDDLTGEQYVHTIANVAQYGKINVTQRSEDGTIQWSTDITLTGFTYWSANKVIQLENGDLVIGGLTFDSGDARYEAFAAKLSGDGTIQWLDTYQTGDDYNYFNGLTLSSDGASVYLTGRYNDYTPINALVFTYFKIDAADGSVFTESEIVLDYRLGFTYGMVGDDTGVYICGYINTPSYNYEGFVLKLNDDGEQVWFKKYTTEFGAVYALDINQDGHIVAAIERANDKLQVLYIDPADGSPIASYIKDLTGISYFFNTTLTNDEAGNTWIAFEQSSTSPYEESILVLCLDNSASLLREYEIEESFLGTLKVVDTEDGSALLTASSYYNPISNYAFTMYELMPDESINTFLFSPYKGYNAISDFTSPDGIQFFLTGGIVPGSSFKNNTLTAHFNDLTMRTISDQHSADLIFYPNPVEDFMVIPGQQTPGMVTVFDNLGRVVGSYSYTGETLQLNASEWPAGTYFLEMGNERMPFIVQ
jgi:hypothetical protein